MEYSWNIRAGCSLPQDKSATFPKALGIREATGFPGTCSGASPSLLGSVHLTEIWAFRYQDLCSGVFCLTETLRHSSAIKYPTLSLSKKTFQRLNTVFETTGKQAISRNGWSHNFASTARATTWSLQCLRKYIRNEDHSSSGTRAATNIGTAVFGKPFVITYDLRQLCQMEESKAFSRTSFPPSL